MATKTYTVSTLAHISAMLADNVTLCEFEQISTIDISTALTTLGTCIYRAPSWLGVQKPYFEFTFRQSGAYITMNARIAMQYANGALQLISPTYFCTSFQLGINATCIFNYNDSLFNINYYYDAFAEHLVLNAYVPYGDWQNMTNLACGTGSLLNTTIQTRTSLLSNTPILNTVLHLYSNESGWITPTTLAVTKSRTANDDFSTTSTLENRLLYVSQIDLSFAVGYTNGTIKDFFALPGRSYNNNDDIIFTDSQYKIVSTSNFILACKVD